MSDKKNTNEKGDKHMAVLTAQCDQPFVVSASKVKAFKEQTRNVKALEKMDILTTKMSKNVRFDVRENNR